MSAANTDRTRAEDERLLERHFPAVRPGPKDRNEPEVFEIALVLAGAVSAGSYTAGVLDFLIEALDQWHLRKAEDLRAGRIGTAAQDVPHHKVVLRIITGTSAGGMNGAIAAAALRYRFPHAVHGDKAAKGAGDPAEGSVRNPFFSAWVEHIDIEPLLDASDIGKSLPISLLNCRRLEEIAAGVVDFQGREPPPGMRDWLANPYEVRLTNTNLRGVPFAVGLRAEEPEAHQGFLMHADQLAFAVESPATREPGEARPDCVRLGLNEPRNSSGWTQLCTAALATGAFPIALSARDIVRNPADYIWRSSYYDVEHGAHLFARPAWPAPSVPSAYAYAAIDGGVMNNEPFDIARYALCGPRGHNPQDGATADRAVIVIDPFVEDPSEGPASKANILRVVSSLLPAQMTQARLSAQDLVQIEAAGIYSRFMIAPTRKNRAGAKRYGKLALATGELGAFFGFFSRPHREHDYFLGRRNAQRFLKAVFTLPAENRLFKDGRWSEANMRAFKDVTSETGDADLHLQIIPVCGTAFPDEPAPAWPKGTYTPRHARIAQRIRLRVEKLGGLLPGQLRGTVVGAGRGRGSFTRLVYRVGSWLAGAWAWLGWRAVRGRVTNALTAAVADAANRLDARE